MNNYKEDIISFAREHIPSDLTLEWKSSSNSNKFDGILHLVWKEQKFNLQGIIKNEVRPSQLSQISDYQKEQDFILIANKIYPKAKEILRQANIAYLEGNGSLFLYEKNTQIWIESNKSIPTIKPKTNRAFTKSGLKVVFHFLMDKNLINQTHREISAKTGVSLGSISWIIQGLKEMGFLLKLNKSTYIWKDRKKLISYWLSAYEITLKPKLERGKYTLRGDWKNIELNSNLSVWGGEPAGDLLTNYLRPENLTLYSQESNVELMKNYRLFAQPDGEIEIFEKFWSTTENQITAPPLLVYADLVIVHDKRCQETAQKIYEQYIEPNL